MSWSWGYDRGTPVDRWYIERFLDEHRGDISGRVLEVKDTGYTDRFGQNVREAATLDIDSKNERATLIADLEEPDSVPTSAFDCFLLTQTLQYIFDLRVALANAHSVLRPGGVLLLTVPVTSRLPDPPLTDYWRFTRASVARLLSEAFGSGTVSVSERGNVLSQIAFLKGLAAEDLAPADLAVDDARFPLIVCARAVRSE